MQTRPLWHRVRRTLRRIAALLPPDPRTTGTPRLRDYPLVRRGDGGTQ
jgi:hypothetical protein